MSEEPSRGRRNPPLHSRFKPGQSGNPKGRPKGRKNMRTVLQAELEKRVSVTENGRRVKRSMAEVALQRLVVDSAKGHHRATELLMRLVRDYGCDRDERGGPLTPEATAVDDGAMPDPVALRRILRRFEHLHGDSEEG